MLLQVHWLAQHWPSSELYYQQPHKETRASQELKLGRHQAIHNRRIGREKREEERGGGRERGRKREGEEERGGGREERKREEGGRERGRREKREEERRGRKRKERRGREKREEERRGRKREGGECWCVEGTIL